ncbi:hypothetical protein DLAC_11614 [Tieghemostelium lacteum]|uniref:Uncharacterized protein n=1 Tax=Tieghemostelium lacteum TaxID=361077 RepID=A0A151ZIJ7_TIELA|nr:hypothetical protein DLAC_11614 [Tieghemostelium lacteum]|eukprot:KYQ93735.1 hypothetical protein DLAC_11614 [Tieghemostelium lacteum]
MSELKKKKSQKENDSSKSLGDKKQSKETEKTLQNSSNSSTSNVDITTELVSCKYPVYCCSSNNNLIAVGGGGGKASTGVPNGINLFQWSKQDKIHRFKELELLVTPDCVSNMSFQNDKDTLAYGIDYTVHVVEYLNGKFRNQKEIDIRDATSGNSGLNKQGEKYEIQSMRFNQTNDRLLVLDNDKIIKIFNTENYKLLKVINSTHLKEINSFDIHPTSTYLATTSKDQSCKIINLLSGKVEHTLQYKHRKQTLAFRGCRFSPDSVYLYTCQSIPKSKQHPGCSVVSKWEFLNGICKEIQSKEFQNSHNTSFELSPNGKYLAIGTADSMITVLSAETLSKVDKWEPHGFIITDLKFSPDSSSVFSVSVDYTCRSHLIGQNSSSESNHMKIILILISLIVLILAYVYNKN